MDIIENLKRIGLTDTESKLYLELLKKGSNTAVQLAKETKIHRRTIYDNLNILIHKGIVNYYVEKGVKYFMANDPKILKVFLEEKQFVLDSVLQKLSKYFVNQEKSPNITIMRGLESAKLIIEEMLKTNKEVLWCGGGFHIIKNLGYSKKFIFNKILKLNMRIIQPESQKTEEIFNSFNKKQIRILSKKYDSLVSFFVYENIVVLGLIQNDEIFSIKIENQNFAKTYHNYFEILWNSALLVNEIHQ